MNTNANSTELEKPSSKKRPLRFPIWRSTKSLLFRFFASYMWLGITLILIAIIAEQSFPTPRAIVISVLINLTSTIGIAILVAAIFTYAVGTTEFLVLIRDLLQSIIVNRNFLNNMDEEAKKDILHAILRPTDQQRDIYGNIESYYRHYIDRSMQVAHTSVRSNYNSQCYVYYSRSENCLRCKYTNTYRVYPSQFGYDDITIGFYGEEEEDLVIKSVTLFFPDGEKKQFTKEDIEKIKFEKDIEGANIKRIKVAGYEDQHAHIDVEFNLLQKGQDHWIQIGFQAMQPTDGFRFSVHCEDPLTIREEQTFIYGAKQFKDPDKVEGSSHATISCQQWIDQGAGTTVLIAVPHNLPDDILVWMAERSHQGVEITSGANQEATDSKLKPMSPESQFATSSETDTEVAKYKSPK